MSAPALYHHDPIIQHVPASQLADHPLLAHIPVWDRASAEFGALLESIRDRGLDYPVLIDHERRVIDGRNRRNACSVLGAPVPCVYVEKGSEAGVIIDSLANRRHLPKGALAYLLVPCLAPALAESKARQVANLSRASTQSTLGKPQAATAADLAASFGFSRDLIFQAQKVRELLDEHAEAHPALRAEIEPQIFAGDLGLGGAVVAITNIVTKGTKAAALGKRNEHDRLFRSALPKLGLHWEEASDTQRESIREQLRAEMLKWPADLTAEMAKVAREVARQHEKATA